MRGLLDSQRDRRGRHLCGRAAGEDDPARRHHSTDTRSGGSRLLIPDGYPRVRLHVYFLSQSPEVNEFACRSMCEYVQFSNDETRRY